MSSCCHTHTEFNHERSVIRHTLTQGESCVWPVLAGDEADLLSLVLGADFTGLPPLLVSTVQHMQHISEPEAQSLTEEATVRSLVIVKKSPERWNILSQPLKNNKC